MPSPDMSRRVRRCQRVAAPECPGWPPASWMKASLLHASPRPAEGKITIIRLAPHEALPPSGWPPTRPCLHQAGPPQGPASIRLASRGPAPSSWPRHEALLPSGWHPQGSTQKLCWQQHDYQACTLPLVWGGSFGLASGPADWGGGVGGGIRRPILANNTLERYIFEIITTSSIQSTFAEQNSHLTGGGGGGVVRTPQTHPAYGLTMISIIF